MKVNDNTTISMPIRNRLAIMAAVAVGTGAYYGDRESLTQIETSDKSLPAELLKKAE